jgi:membrane-bound lytic murein transglycosylase D
VKNNRFLVVVIPLLALLNLPVDHVAAGTGSPAPHFATIRNGFRYGFPPGIEKRGFWFAGRRIRFSRTDIRDRVLKEINYLLLDRRSRVRVWLYRAHEYSSVILPILSKYHVPREFIYLAAIESGYNSRALSSAGAYGYWQFIKATAKRGVPGSKEYDWAMSMSKWRDERADLISSTHSAARYLAWMNRKQRITFPGNKQQQGFQDWLLTAAAYNAGPARIQQRMKDFGGSSYWDLPLPDETEKYVPRWIAIGLISRYRKFYGLRVDLPPKINFDRVRNVQLKKNLSFAALARLLEITPRAVWALNTQVAPEKAVFPARYRGRRIKHTICVPKGTGKKLLAKLKAHGYIK